MFLGLVKDPGRDWRPWDDAPEPGPHRSWHVPWGIISRLALWVAVISGMFALVPVADHVLGNLAGYVLILFTVALGVWRIDRWFSHQYWDGLQDYKP